MKTKKPRRISKEPVERDQGFNEAHGYGVGHGGPSGPGDAPAPVASPPPPPRAPAVKSGSEPTPGRASRGR